MTTKTAAFTSGTSSEKLSDNPWTDAGTPKPLIRIQGLKEVRPGLFELDAEGIPRQIDWSLVVLGLGFKGAPFPESLAERIAGEVFREDVMVALRERIEV